MSGPMDPAPTQAPVPLPAPAWPVPVSPLSSRSVRTVAIAAAAVTTLVVLVLIGLVEFGGGGPSDGTEVTASPSVGAVMTLLVVAVLLIVGSCVAVFVVRGQRAARVRAEESRDRAVERAQLLAAAMDPETAMRLLGYDGRSGHNGAD